MLVWIQEVTTWGPRLNTVPSKGHNNLHFYFEMKKTVNTHLFIRPFLGAPFITITTVFFFQGA